MSTSRFCFDDSLRLDVVLKYFNLLLARGHVISFTPRYTRPVGRTGLSRLLIGLRESPLPSLR